MGTHRPIHHPTANTKRSWHWHRCITCQHIWNDTGSPVECPLAKCDGDVELAPVSSVSKAQQKDQP